MQTACEATDHGWLACRAMGVLEQRQTGRLRAGAIRGPSGGQAVALLGVGHVAWGAVAYRRELADLLRGPVFDSVGDGIFNRKHAHDGRAAAFWFMFAAPLVTLCGLLADSALRAGDHRSATTAGRVIVGVSCVGLVVIPRSGFPAALPAGWLLLRQARQVRDAATSAGPRPPGVDT